MIRLQTWRRIRESAARKDAVASWRSRSSYGVGVTRSKPSEFVRLVPSRELSTGLSTGNLVPEPLSAVALLGSHLYWHFSSFGKPEPCSVAAAFSLAMNDVFEEAWRRAHTGIVSASRSMTRLVREPEMQRARATDPRRRPDPYLQSAS